VPAGGQEARGAAYIAYVEQEGLELSVFGEQAMRASTRDAYDDDVVRTN
jgi:hypothetical protein